MAGIICLTACGKQDDYETQSKSLFAMDTYMNITTYGENTESALNKAEEQIRELEKSGLLQMIRVRSMLSITVAEAVFQLAKKLLIYFHFLLIFPE